MANQGQTYRLCPLGHGRSIMAQGQSVPRVGETLLLNEDGSATYSKARVPWTVMRVQHEITKGDEFSASTVPMVFVSRDSEPALDWRDWCSVPQKDRP